MQSASRRIVAQEVLTWAEGDDLENILHDLKRFDIKPAALISDRFAHSEAGASDIPRQPSEYLRGRHDRVFLILSSSVMHHCKSELRQCGYHSGLGYVVWDA
jgi:hypothetical protein